MAEELTYAGKPLSSYDVWALGAILKSMNDVLAKREEARSHKKFEKMDFPPPNPEFLKLKNAVEEAIRKKQENDNK